MINVFSVEIILVNRLVLNLSHAVNTREDSEFRTRTNLEPPTFASGPFLGNIGGPVHTFADSPYDGDEAEGALTEDGVVFQRGPGWLDDEEGICA